MSKTTLSIPAGLVNGIKAQPRQTPGKHQRCKPGDASVERSQQGIKQVKAKKMVYLHVQVPNSHYQEAPGKEVETLAKTAAFQCTGSGKCEEYGYEKKGKLHDAKPVAEGVG